MGSALALLLLLSTPLVSASRDSREGVDLRNLEGVRQVFSYLRPGVSARFAFGAPGSDPIRIGGHELACSYGSGLIMERTAATLSNGTLYPGFSYVAYLRGTVVEVVRVG